MRIVPFLFLIPIAACGAGNPGGDDAGVPGDAPNITDHLEPWSIGAAWTYLDTDNSTGEQQVEHTTVEAWEDVGGAHAGTMAFRVRAGKIAGPTVSWEGYLGDLGVRYAQDDYDTFGTKIDSLTEKPRRLKVDQTPAHMVDGATFSETYTESSSLGSSKTHTENWSVVSAAESLTVPAGTYTTLHVHRVDPSSGKFKDYWFVAGLGKVKETGGNQTEELMAYAP